MFLDDKTVKEIFMQLDDVHEVKVKHEYSEGYGYWRHYYITVKYVDSVFLIDFIDDVNGMRVETTRNMNEELLEVCLEFMRKHKEVNKTY